MAIKPMLRWAGGKGWLLNHIDKLLPNDFDDYYEPFLGGGAVYFFLKSNGYIQKRAFLSDVNRDLINTYKAIKSSPKEVVDVLLKFKNTKEDYYVIRKQLFDNDIENAAKFIFLNRTSFNGIYRVNRNGDYNVPYGYRNLKDIVNPDEIYQISELFKNTFFSVRDFKIITKKIKPNDFVYLDPPYTVSHENNGFIQYNQSLFSWKNQEELSNILDVINERKGYYILSNASHDSIVELYKGKGVLTKLKRPSTVGGLGAKRQYYNEILISNING